jgi:hypothetical protein
MLWDQPHILKDTLEWPQMDAWIDDKMPNYSKLLKEFGKCTVSVCDDKQDKIMMSFEDAIIKMKECKYYIKDFHFYQQVKEYKLPQVLQDDFLNEYFDLWGEDDYRFLYLGTNGTSTPMHHDVLKSFSWSVNLTGCKKWTFVSPDQEKLLMDAFGNVLENIYDYDQNRFKDAINVQTLEIDQAPGQIIFVPSGWYHQVVNIGETLSINHNWINAHNLECVFEYLESVFGEIQDLIQEHSDMDNFQGHCQKMLKANCGMNIYEFLDMIDHSMEIRITRHTQSSVSQDKESLECFLQVLNRCATSKIASESFSKIQFLRHKVVDFLQGITVNL